MASELKWQVAVDELRRVPVMAEEHVRIDERAKTYILAVMRWLGGRPSASRADNDDPEAVIAQYSLLIGSKIHRALKGHGGFYGEGSPRDYDGTANVALISIEHSHAAWLQLVESGQDRTTHLVHGRWPLTPLLI